jgi:head-tail adaptor
MTTRPYIRPRKMDKRVRIELKTVTKGASGGKRETWSLVAVVWAGISNKAGREQRSTSAGGGEVGVGDSEIEIRYRAGVTATTHRIVHGATIYDILHVDDVLEQHDRMLLSCRTGVSNG